MVIGVTPQGGSQYFTCDVGESSSNSPAQVECSATVTGTADLVLVTQHDLYTTYQSWQIDPYNCYLYGCDTWSDAYETSLLGVNGQQYSWDQSWFAQGPPAVPVPETRTMEASLWREKSVGCGNRDKDSLITEYKDPGNRQTWVPGCGDFTNSAGSTHFQFPELNKSNDYSWGIIRSSLLDGLERVRTAGGDQAMPVTSGYRNPASQMRIDPQHPNSQHTRGDCRRYRRDEHRQAEPYARHLGSRLRSLCRTAGLHPYSCAFRLEGIMSCGLVGLRRRAMNVSFRVLVLVTALGLPCGNTLAQVDLGVLQALYQDMQSSDQGTRFKAFQTIQANEEFLKYPETADRILAFLDLESTGDSPAVSVRRRLRGGLG